MTDTGGPAFGGFKVKDGDGRPGATLKDQWDRYAVFENVQGMELLDWFAGQALMGILSNSQYPTQSSGEPFDQYAARVTDTAYKIADAMIKHGRRRKKEMCSTW